MRRVEHLYPILIDLGVGLGLFLPAVVKRDVLATLLIAGVAIVIGVGLVLAFTVALARAMGVTL